MKYLVAEKFKSVQGEGVYAGTPMAFIRFVGCSVGKRICQHCDTDFDKTMPWRGGGEFTAEQLLEWARPYQHICFTGGEPLNQDLRPFVENWAAIGQVRRSDPLRISIPTLHIETSGTVDVGVAQSLGLPLYICVSPKPGFDEENIRQADEVKVIVPGLGEVTQALAKSITGLDVTHDLTNFRWPTLEDALRWADEYPSKPIFLQPRNGKLEVDKNNLMYVMDLLRDHPQLRLSAQLHKILKVQ